MFSLRLLRRVAKEVTPSLLSWHKRYDFNAANFRRHIANENARYKRNELDWIFKRCVLLTTNHQ